MLKITVGTNTSRKTVMATEDTTLRQCLEDLCFSWLFTSAFFCFS